MDYVVEHKFDGLSIVADLRKWRAGARRHARRRHDGRGRHANVQTIRSIPSARRPRMLKKLALPRDFEVRGEIIMTAHAFEALNRQQESRRRQAFCESAQCRCRRRARARSADHRLAQTRFLRLLLAGEWTRAPEAPFAISRSVWRNCASRPAPIARFATRSTQSRNIARTWEGKREKLPYEIDGIVIKVNEVGMQDGIGLHVEGSALGHRLQMGRAAGNDPRQRRLSSTLAAPARSRPWRFRAGAVGGVTVSRPRCITWTKSSGWTARLAIPCSSSARAK